MYLMTMVLDNSSQLNDVLQAWIDSGVRGITILESTGVNRVLPRDHAEPMFAGFSRIFGSGRVGHNTLLAVVESMTVIETAVAATEKVVGNLNDPHTGVVFVTPVVKTWGIPESYEQG